MRIPIPKEHGAWAMIYAPFVIAVLSASQLSVRVIWLVISITAMFFAHGPLFTMARLNPRQPDGPQRIREAKQWLFIYFLLAGFASAPLVFLDHLSYLIPAGLGAVLLLLIQTRLSAKKEEKSVSSEFLVVISLTSCAPLTLYVLEGRWTASGWLLWLLCALYFGSSIFYVKMLVSRFAQKEDARTRSIQCAVYHSCLALVTFLLVRSDWLPLIAVLAFVPIILRAFWKMTFPGKRLNLRIIGLTEFAWTLLFVIVLSVSLN